MASYVERFQNVEEAGRLFNKGYKFTEIARELNISNVQASALVREYKELLKLRAENDPDFLERITENTLEMMDSMDTILKEAWDTYRKAKDFDAINMMNTALKLTMDITERKAKLLQLMGAKADGGNIARLNRAERVNEIVSSIIKEIIADCPKCRQLAQIKLAEAFTLMGNAEEGSTMEEFDDGEVLELEPVEEYDEHEHDHILGDVLNNE